MKKSIILIKKQSFIYKNQEYFFDQYEEVEKTMGKNREFIILEEELYSRCFKENIKKSKIYEYIEFKLNKEFHKNDDILYHYEYDRKNNDVIIYSIKGGRKVELLSSECNDINVLPIQFVIKDAIMENLNNHNVNFNCIVCFCESYYYIEIVNKKFHRAFVEKNIDTLGHRINNFSDFNKERESIFYVDSNIKNKDIIMLDDISKEIKKIHINCEDLLYEKIYKKPKLYSKKVL